MADPRSRNARTNTGTNTGSSNSGTIHSGLESLCRNAERLQTAFPPPCLEKSGSWRPAPWDLGPASAWLARGMPSSVL